MVSLAARRASVMTEDISPQELKGRLERKEPVVLLDVREGWETALCRLENSIHIRLEELNAEDEIVVYCHHGIRSAAVASFLRGQGFAKAVNLAGGLDLWAQSVDRAMRRY